MRERNKEKEEKRRKSEKEIKWSPTSVIVQ